MATKAEEVTTIRMVEISKKETHQIRENPGTKATKEVVLQVEEEVVVKSQTRVTFSVTIVRSMVTILVIVQKSRRIKKLMQNWRNMKKKRRSRWLQQEKKRDSRTSGTWTQDAHHTCLEEKIGLST